MDDILFSITDPDNRYTLEQICAILRMAEHQGYFMGKGSYLQDMTVRQLDALIHGRADA